MATIIAPARRAGQLALRPRLGTPEDVEREDDRADYELDETDTALLLAEVELLLVELEQLHITAPSMAGDWLQCPQCNQWSTTPGYCGFCYASR